MSNMEFILRMKASALIGREGKDGIHLSRDESSGAVL